MCSTRGTHTGRCVGVCVGVCVFILKIYFFVSYVVIDFTLDKFPNSLLWPVLANAEKSEKDLHEVPRFLFLLGLE